MKWILGLATFVLLGASNDAFAQCASCGTGRAVFAGRSGVFVQRTRIRIFQREGVRFRLFRRGGC